MSELLHVTDVLKRAGLIDMTYFDKIAAWRGSAVHQACQYLDQGTLDRKRLDPELRGYVRAWESFKKELRPTILTIEQPVECAQYGYCGTLDRILIVRDCQIVVDLKSSKQGRVHPATRFQLAAYAYAWKPRAFLHRYAVALTPRGKYRVTVYPQEELFRDFQAFLRALEWVKRNGGTTGASNHPART